MRTREERQADRQARRQARRDNRNELITGVVNAALGNTPTPPPITPPPTPETETETPVVNPQEEELKRQAREVMSGNVNAAQAEYFRQQNEGLFDTQKRKIQKIKGVNPVSNRRDGMSELFGGLYGSEESRGF